MHVYVLYPSNDKPDSNVQYVQIPSLLDVI